MDGSRLEIKVSAMCDEVQRLEDVYGPLVKEVEELESKYWELDAKLAASTPQAYYDRVLTKLECTGSDVSLLLEALNDATTASGESKLSKCNLKEHGMGEASTGRYFTLQERATQPALLKVDDQQIDVSAGGESTLEIWLKLEMKYGSRAAILAHVREIKNRVARKAAQLDAVTPAKMTSRIKHKLSWLGDISLLFDALYDRSLTESIATAESASNLRQLVLLEAGSRPRETKAAAVELPLEEPEEETKPKGEEKVLVPIPRVVGRKRREARALSDGNLDRAGLHSESKRPAMCSTTRSSFDVLVTSKGPITRSK